MIFYILILILMENLLEQLKKIHEAVPKQSDRIVSYYGYTGSGKSSLICYELDANISFRKEAGRYLLEHQANPNLPTIGTDLSSCTELPQFYKKGTAIYADLPGNIDSKGDTQEMVNSYANTKVFVQGKSYKMVIVVEIGSLFSARGGPLAPLIQRLEELFGDDFLSMANSSYIVASKVNLSEYNPEDINFQVNDIIKKNSYFTPGSKGHTFVQTILKKDRILIFPLPNQITKETIKKIEQSIEQAPFLQLQNNAKMSLSPSAKLLIQSWKNEAVTSMRAKSTAFEGQIKARYNKNYNTVQQGQNCYNLMSRCLSLMPRLANLDDFPIPQLANLLSCGQNEANQMLSQKDKLKKMEVLYSNIFKDIDLHSNLKAALTLCQSVAQNEINRINSQEALRRQREQQQAQLRERERRAQQERRRIAEQQAQRARELQEQQQREAERQRRQFEEQQRRHAMEAERLRRQINTYVPPRSRSPSPPGCKIM